MVSEGRCGSDTMKWYLLGRTLLHTLWFVFVSELWGESTRKPSLIILLSKQL